MGLRFYEKYLLLFGTIAIGLFILSGTIVYFSTTKQQQDPLSFPKPLQQQKEFRQKALRDLANRGGEDDREDDSGMLRNVSNNVNSRDNEYRKNFVKNMMKLAWNGYVQYAWGDNELKPITKVGHSGSIFGRAQLGASIVDAADTLYIMDLQPEFTRAKEWIREKFSLRESTADLSLFETNIRFIGGLLSIYALTKEQLFLDKAKAVADLLLPAFDTPTGIPMALINVRTGQTGNYGWASSGCSILSEFGTLELEFDYLSRLTGDQVYVTKCRRIREFVTGLDKPDGLYPNYVNPRTGKWCQKHVSVGALGDSFYEYLLKIWIFDGKRNDHLWDVYTKAVDALENKLLYKSKPNNLTYFAEMKGSRIEHKMDHLACFIAGMFALQSTHETDEGRRAHYLELAEQIGHTCHESYTRTATGLGPEAFRFTSTVEARSLRDSESYYILRPEVVEAWFYLWRVTGKQKYRDWCWEAVQALERHCRAEAGYSGIRNVNVAQAEQDDVQQSFFLAETLKYLYLAFSDSTEFPLDQWVFNTEAHPFPIVSAA